MIYFQIALVSVAALFLEMILIRWVAAEIRVFAYMHNLLLVASFLGIGIGCFRARKKPEWVRGLIALFVLTFIVTDPFDWRFGNVITSGIAAAADTVIWDNTVRSGAFYQIFVPTLAILMTLSIVLLTALTLEPFGQTLGSLMDNAARPIGAYSANLFGSLLGTWGFFALSALSTTPALWFGSALVLAAPLVVLAKELSLRGKTAALVFLAAPFLTVAFADQRAQGVKKTYWSPYQKLAIEPRYLPARAGSDREISGYMIWVNNTGYQVATNLAFEFRDARAELFPEHEVCQYDVPYQVVPHAKRVLLVGSGSGNDVAGALRNGAEHIDAVEIDPIILRLGRELHPERPYASPKVNAVVDDARSFFKRAEPDSYDLICFGLLDSHTTGSGYTTLRLDHYVYTRESFHEAHRLLKSDGVIVCTFETGDYKWLGDRIGAMLAAEFGVQPISFRILGATHGGVGGEMFIAGSEAALARIRAAIDGEEKLKHLKKLYDSGKTPHADTTPPTTDDWPYLYLQRRAIPTGHVMVGLVVILGCLGMRRNFVGTQPIAWPFFFLGAAFLLLETLGVSRAALLFGATWSVTAIVVSAVLGMALLANCWVAFRQSQSLAPPFVGILLCGAALVFVPLDIFSGLAPIPKALAAGSFLAAPDFFSGLIFTRLFQAAPQKDVALGSNLFGAIAGGMCEMASFIFGLRALTLFAIGLYVAAVWCARRKD